MPFIARMKPVLMSLLAVGVLGTAPASADGLAGSYLAATQANFRNDYREAAKYFQQAIVDDPGNAFLIQNAIVNSVIANDFEVAKNLAGELRSVSPNAQLAGLVLIADALSGEDYDTAAALLADDDLRLNPLLSGLLRGWVSAGQGKTSEAADYLDQLALDTDFGALGSYHKALVFALAGNFDGALELFEGRDGNHLRVNQASILAHAQILVQLDRRDDAVAMLDTEIAERPSQDIIDLRAAIENDEPVSFDYVTSPLEGAAEVFLTLATALDQEDALRFAILYGRLAQRVRGDYVDAYLLTADLLESQEQYALAIEDYARIPRTSPVFRSAAIGRADAMASAGDVDQAIEELRGLTSEFPSDQLVHIALGDLLRREEIYQEAVASYTRAIELSDTPSPRDWRTYYVRGIAYERLDDFENAEKDFRQSLSISPDQPLVLNYLGYSLVEKNMKIDEARGMIERAVEARPDDGYITDSLGWVLYKLGEFEAAVPHMERAVELAPTDPIINDHLGDVFWVVGRKLEAEFQWRRALSFDPEEEDAERIRRKLDVGLDEVLAEESQTEAQ